MKALLEFLPIAIFFGADKLYDLKIATMATMVATLILLFERRYSTGKWDKMMMISAALVVVLGGVTVFTDNPLFIQYKLTVFYIALSLFFWISHQFFGKNWLLVLYRQALPVGEATGRIILFGTIGFFASLAIINVVLIHYLTIDEWVNIKFWGLLPLTFIFALWQGMMVMKDPAVKAHIANADKAQQ